MTVDRKRLLNELPDQVDKLSVLPDAVDTARMAGPLVSKADDTPKASLLEEYGIGAGLLAFGGLVSKAKFAPRLMGKGLLNLGLHGLRRTGAKIGHSAVGGLAGAAVITPTAYLGAKAAENSANDKEFDTKNFASIAAPAAAGGLLGYGTFSNISQSIAQADKSGYKGMVKNIVSPKRNIRYSKHGFKLAGRAFTGKGKGRLGGMLALGFMGMEAIAPGMYLNQTLNKKKDGNNEQI